MGFFHPRKIDKGKYGKFREIRLVKLAVGGFDSWGWPFVHGPFVL